LEAKLAEYVNRLKDAAGDNLRSVVLFGSAVSGEFCEGYSDLNILCLLERAGAADLAQMHSAVNWWIEEGNRAPLLFKFDELARAAGLFALEMLDIKTNHRVLFGPDWLENFQLPQHLHGVQTGRELHLERLKLRQAVLAKRESVAAIASWTGADPSGFEAILDYREGKRTRRQIDVEASLHSYLEFVEIAVNDFDRRLAERR